MIRTSFLSLNGYGNPLSFKDVVDDDIGQIEKSMKRKNPTFEFRPGDKKLIKSIVEYVKNIVDGNGKCKGLSHFNNEDNVPAAKQPELQAIKKFGEYETRTHFFLRKLMAVADQNANRNKHGYRHNDPELRMYAA